MLDQIYLEKVDTMSFRYSCDHETVGFGGVDLTTVLPETERNFKIG